MKLMRKAFIGLSFLLFVLHVFSQEEVVEVKENQEKEVLKFDTVVIVKTTPVKSQARTGTCWDYATTSFLESELLRMGKGEYDLAEMYIVKHTYPKKAKKYVRYHGAYNFGQGGQAHDLIDTYREFGMVPEEAYNGLELGLPTHNHSELAASLKAYLDVVIANKSGIVTPVWEKAFEAILTTYLGENPNSFEYKGKTYTPQSFAAELDLNPDDYVEFTSYSLYPMWEKCILEVPDNWSNGEYYNVPLDELMEIMYYSLEKGFSIAWDGDVSDKYFSSKAGVAIVPEEEHKESSKENIMDYLKRPQAEKSVNQDTRDKAFINYSTTDDHLMHLSGLAKDQNGINYFLTKNSHGTEQRAYGGFIYMSDSFVRLRTVAFMVHKDAIPKSIAKKLGIK